MCVESCVVEFCFFKQKTAYEMRISDWSSDVCSSDLDVAVWLRFLDACGKTVWAATRDDVDAYHRERRRDEADHRITAASWNRAVASFDRLYRWGEQQGLIADAPFNRRAVWRPRSEEHTSESSH